MKYKNVLDDLRAKIFCGDYPAGSQLPKQETLAQTFSITRPTVIRALNQLETEGLIVRHRGLGIFVQETVKLKTGMRFGLLRPTISGAQELYDSFSNLMLYMSDYARKGDCSVLGDGFVLASEDKIIRGMFDAVDHLIKRQIHGVLFVPPELASDRQMVNLEVAERFEKAGISVVLFDRSLPSFEGACKHDIVSINHFRGSFTLTEHLIALGVSKIAFLSSDCPTSAVCERIGGFLAALAKHRIAPQNNQVLYFGHNAMSSDQKEKIISTLMNTHIEAVICICDFVAYSLFESLSAKGIQVPRDIRLAGFDDLPIAQAMACPLTTIRQPMDRLAQAAVTALLHRVSHPDSPPCEISVQEELIIRQSSGSKKS